MLGASALRGVLGAASLRRGVVVTFLNLAVGVPSADPFRRVFSALDPKAFRQGFFAWSQAIADRVTGLHIAVDGKTVRSFLPWIRRPRCG